MTPLGNWPPFPLRPIAWGTCNTAAMADSVDAFGIDAVIFTAVAGRVRLRLNTPVEQAQFLAEVSCPTQGMLANAVWINTRVVEVITTVGGVLTAGDVYFEFFAAGATSHVVTPNPSNILGSNLAVWLQGDLGTGPGPTVPTWVNQAGHGNAVQGAITAPPSLVPNSFGTKPGVSAPLGTEGLTVTLTTPIAVGKRPTLYCKFRLTTVTGQPLGWFLFQAPANFASTMNMGMLPPPSFDPLLGFWYVQGFEGPDGMATLSAGDTPPVDTLPHTVRARWNQVEQLLIDGLIGPTQFPSGTGLVNPTDVAIDTLRLAATDQAPFPAVNGPPFINFGIVLLSYDQPTTAQDAQLRQYVAAYGT